MVLAAAILWPVAAAMSYIIAALVKWAAGARTPLTAAVVLFLLVMMAAMFLGALLYFAYPGRSGLLLGLWSAAGIMAISVSPVFWLFVRDVQQRVAQGPEYRAAPLGSVGAFAGWVAVSVFAGEFLMGRTFQLASGESGPVGPGALGLLAAAASSVSSDWFLFPMAAEMGLTVLLLRARVPRALAVALGLQAISMFASPTALSSPTWVIGSSVAAAVLMLVLFAYVMSVLYRGTRLPTAVLRYLALLVVVYAVMAGGLAVWAFTGSPAVFAASAVAQMALFFTTVVATDSLAPSPASGTQDQGARPDVGRATAG